MGEVGLDSRASQKFIIVGGGIMIWGASPHIILDRKGSEDVAECVDRDLEERAGLQGDVVKNGDLLGAEGGSGEHEGSSGTYGAGGLQDAVASLRSTSTGR